MKIFFLIITLLYSLTAIAGSLTRSNKIYYQIFIDTFYDGDQFDASGDFKGIIEKIPYLKSLGVNGLILMPIHDSVGNGYIPNDYFSIRTTYGNSQFPIEKIENFKSLVSKLKENNLEVFLDAPINQMTTQTTWYKEHPEYFVTAKQPIQGWRFPWDENSIPEDVWFYDDLHKHYYYALFGDGLVELNYHNKKLKNEIKRYFKFWSDLGVDGFRIDAAKHLLEGKTNLDSRYLPNIKLIDELLSDVQKNHPHIDFILEVWDSRETIDYYLSNIKNAAAFEISYMESLRDSLKSKQAYTIRDELNKLADSQEQFPHGSRILTIGNHDIQRLRTAVDNDVRRAQLAYAITLFLPFNKQLYYGDEIFMPGDLIRSNIKIINEVMSPMAWDKSKNAGFTLNRYDMGSDWNRKLHWDYQVTNVESMRPKSDSLLNLVRGMISMHKDFNFSPQTKIYIDNYNTDQQILKITLQDERNCAFGFFNFSQNEAKLSAERLQGICRESKTEEVYTKRALIDQNQSLLIQSYGFWIGKRN